MKNGYFIISLKKGGRWKNFHKWHITVEFDKNNWYSRGILKKRW